MSHTKKTYLLRKQKNTKTHNWYNIPPQVSADFCRRNPRCVFKGPWYKKKLGLEDDFPMDMEYQPYAEKYTSCLPGVQYPNLSDL